MFFMLKYQDLHPKTTQVLTIILNTLISCKSIHYKYILMLHNAKKIFISFMKIKLYFKFFKFKTHTKNLFFGNFRE